MSQNTILADLPLAICPDCSRDRTAPASGETGELYTCPVCSEAWHFVPQSRVRRGDLASAGAGVLATAMMVAVGVLALADVVPAAHAAGMLVGVGAGLAAMNTSYLITLARRRRRQQS